MTEAGSATWSATPLDNRWNNAQNWTPQTVPKRPADTATFGTSSITDPLLSTSINLNGITFSPGASAYAINTTGVVTFAGSGIANNSGITENITLSLKGTNEGYISFKNSATAGTSMAFTLKPGSFGTYVYVPTVEFDDTASAGSASFTLEGGLNSTIDFGGTVYFYNNSTAAGASFTINGAKAGFEYGGYLYYGSSLPSTLNGNFVINGGTAASAYGGYALFDSMSDVTFNGSVTINATPGNYGGELDMYSAEATLNGPFIVNSGGNQPLYVGAYIAPRLITVNGPLTVNGGTMDRSGGGYVSFLPGAVNPGTGSVVVNGGSVAGAGGGWITCQTFDAGVSSYTVNGGNGRNASGGVVNFYDTSGVSGTLIANGGTNRGLGGSINVSSSNAGSLGRLEAFGNGSINFGSWDVDPQTVGSIEGSGTISGDNIWTGSNNLSTTFSGTLSITSLTKVGTGTLTLARGNSYFGGVTVTDGTLLVTNTSGSATGTGAVAVNSGTLGGNGIITGAVTIGQSSSNEAFLAPGNLGVGSLTLKSSLTFNVMGTYACELNSNTITADKTLAKGVTINSAAEVAFTDLGTSVLPTGTAFTVIDNTSSMPITGAFGNLAAGTIVTIGNNSYQVSYTGGTGNDLVLTVVP